jgi:hypothetical protein
LKEMSSFLTIWTANIVSWSSFRRQIFYISTWIAVLNSCVSNLSSKSIHICKIIFIMRWSSGS